MSRVMLRRLTPVEAYEIDGRDSNLRFLAVRDTTNVKAGFSILVQEGDELIQLEADVEGTRRGSQSI